MSTYTQVLYHIVFSTKDREPCLDADNRPNLFRDIWGIIIRKHNCHLCRINGVQDHIHILSSLHPTVTLADFIKDIKLGSSSWMKESGAFPRFRYWQEGYGAFTSSWSERNALIEYIKNQEEHHRKRSFLEEYRTLLQESGIEFEEKYLA
jgi:putative transposase